MQERHVEKRPEMTWLEMDVMDLKFGENEFDLVIDKGWFIPLPSLKSSWHVLRNDGVSPPLSFHYELPLNLPTVLCWRRRATRGWATNHTSVMPLDLTVRRIPRKRISRPAHKKFQKPFGTVPFIDIACQFVSSLDIYTVSYGNARDLNLPSEWAFRSD